MKKSPYKFGLQPLITKSTTLLFLIFFINSCKKDDPISEIVDPVIEIVDPVVPGGAIALDEKNYFVDTKNSLVLYNGNPVNFDTRLIIEKDTFEITPVDKELLLGKAYTATHENTTYQLYRTEIPMVSLSSEVFIEDEPKVPGKITILEKGQDPFNSLIGIETRGGFSQSFPKKSYSVELWEDNLGNDTKSESLLGLREDDDWIFDGLWNEPLRIRDFSSHALWLEIARFNYSAEEPEAKLGIERKYCEVFLNGAYWGIYYMGEKVDRKQLKLKKYNAGIRGELFKGQSHGDGVNFYGVEPYDNNEMEWSGYETKYPDDVGEFDWANIQSFVDFVVTSEKSVFDAGIANWLDIQNAVDYYLFMNMTFAQDNNGKNLYTGRYDVGSPYFFVAWDMDGTFGDDWRGLRFDDTNFILSNGLFDRLINSPIFVNELKSRWAVLKTTSLSAANLKKLLGDNFDYLKANGAYERETLDEELLFNFYDEEPPFNSSDMEIDFINSWIDSRLVFLDNHISSL